MTAAIVSGTFIAALIIACVVLIERQRRLKKDVRNLTEQIEDFLNNDKMTPFSLYDNDFAKLQQIQFFKYLGFSLDDIKEMTLREVDSKTILDSFHMQMGLIEERMEQLELMKSALKDASDIIERGADADWSHMLDLVNMNEMEQKLKKQYKDASNISARINLHRDYSLNPVSWFE